MDESGVSAAKSFPTTGAGVTPAIKQGLAGAVPVGMGTEQRADGTQLRVREKEGKELGILTLGSAGSWSPEHSSSLRREGRKRLSQGWHQLRVPIPQNFYNCCP